MGENYGEIMWIPCPTNFEEADYKRDSLEIIDGIEKLSEFNAKFGTHFKMGFGKMWMPMGPEYVRERVYLSNLNACLDVISYYYMNCRILNLGHLTTSTDVHLTKPVGISGSENLMFLDCDYFTKWGFRLTDYCLRNMRQRIKVRLGEEGVEPGNWKLLVSGGVVRTPGYYTKEGRVEFTPPDGAPFKEIILKRAEIRAALSVCKDSRMNLPALPGLNFDTIKFSARNMSADQVCKNIRVYRGNGVKTTVLSVNSDFIPDKAMERFNQERGLGSGKLVSIPDGVSITAITVTVSNRKEIIDKTKPDLSARLGSPIGEKEKGEVPPTTRKNFVEEEPRAAHDREDDRPHSMVEKVKRLDRCEDLDSSLDKPTKKKSRKSKETSSSSSEESDSSSDDADGEPMTMDRIAAQALKAEHEMSLLLKYKKRFKRERQIEREKEKKQRKRQSKSARDSSSD
jgi:hypothetical protein